MRRGEWEGDGNAEGNKEVASDWCESTAAVIKKKTQQVEKYRGAARKYSCF